MEADYRSNFRHKRDKDGRMSSRYLIRIKAAENSPSFPSEAKYVRAEWDEDRGPVLSTQNHPKLHSFAAFVVF